jgi:hypothetical protein
MPEFREVVAQSWVKPVSTANKARTLHIKLARLANVLKRWHKQKMVDSKREYTEVQGVAHQVNGNGILVT